MAEDPKLEKTAAPAVEEQPVPEAREAAEAPGANDVAASADERPSAHEAVAEADTEAQAAEAQAAEAPAAEAQTAETQTAEAPEAEAAEAGVADVETPAAPEGGDGAALDPSDVSRLLEEAVESADSDVSTLSAESADVDLTDAKEPETSITLDQLQRSEAAPGFTGEIVGRTVTLEDLQSEDPRDTDPAYMQLRQLVEETSQDVREMTIVEGRVLKVTDKDVVIDIGYKSDGIISKGEFDRDLAPGDTVEVYLDRKEDRDGQLVLSKTEADRVRRWERVEEIFENEEVIEGTIIRRIKGGMIAELFDGLEAFLPGSQIDVRPVRDFDAYLDKRMEFKIVKLNPSNENIVVSHRALIQKELEAQREVILDSLEVGQVLQGTVKNIVDFGVFIDLGGVDGLLHITDLSWGRVSHPSEIVDLDQDIQVVVLDYEEERQRISLGLKQLQPHPWDNIGEKYDEGETVEGKVVSITNYGAFVELEKGIEGLVHISEMSWTRHIKHPSQMVSLGQLVDVSILNIDEEEKKISLGMKQLEPDPWDGISERYPAGTVMTGTIRNITHFGVFVEIEPGIDGLVHISDLSWTKKVRHPGDMVNRGDDMDVVILNIDEERRRISLGHKQVKTNPWDQLADAYAEGTDAEGEVVRVEDKGLVVELPLGVEAFVPGSELKNGPRNFQQHYVEGDELELRVIRFDRGRKDIVMSETAKDRQEAHAERQAERREKQQKRREERRSVREFSKREEATSGPTTLGELSGLADLKAQMQAAEAEEVEDMIDETDGFPEGFPQTGRLENAGVMSLADLRAYDDFTEIDGIGDAYAEEIEEALDVIDAAKAS
jgi:small subunit ribosomal protein S1